jgi:hypothetical protein
MLTEKQLAAIKAVMPLGTPEDELHARTLVVDATRELICLTGGAFGKCPMPIELPAMPEAAKIQDYYSQLASVGARVQFGTVSTKRNTGGYDNKYLCRLFLNGQKEPAHVVYQNPRDYTEKESLAGVNLSMVKSMYEWIAKH